MMNGLRLKCICRVGTIVLAISALATMATAQVDTEFDRPGFRPNHDYLELQPFEHLDTESGNVIITLPMLTLPGNAGHDLTFELTYNSNTMAASQPWTFGIAGLVMRIQDVATGQPFANVNDVIGDNPSQSSSAPVLLTGDGGEHPTVFVQSPDTSSTSSIASTLRQVESADFWRYDRLTHTLSMPDGTVCHYDATTLILKDCSDSFGNTLVLTWATGSLQVVQNLGTETREIDFAMNDASQLWSPLPTAMSFNGHTWTYQYIDDYAPGELLTGITPPAGAPWGFSYSTPFTGYGPRLHVLTTPQGGTITYGYFQVQLSQPNDYRVLLHTRDAGTPNGVSGQWVINYSYDEGCLCSDQTIVDTPLSSRLTFNYLASSGPNSFAGGVSLQSLSIADPGGGTVRQLETRSYADLPVVWHSSNVELASTELASRTIVRDGRSYSTAYQFGTTAYPELANYHHPTFVTETGDLTRTTARTYLNLDGELLPYIVGLPTSETVTTSGQSLTRAWTYNQANGFRSSERAFGNGSAGLLTTFTDDGYGNVATATKGNNKTTSFTYSFGRVKNTTTPEFETQRVINPDGTVQSETQAGRTTAYEYDAVSRLTVTHTPGDTNAIVINYDSPTETITTRGASQVTTTVDGFGRPTKSVDSLSVVKTNHYDAEGRKIFESYPYVLGGADNVGTSFTYDTLDRVVAEDEPGNAHRSRSYSGNVMTATDENNHSTAYTRLGFGDPDDTWLTQVVDADQNAWSYSYSPSGALAEVDGPNGVSRTWHYNNQNLLDSETHPESGAVTYTYDGAGVLKTKTDARGITSQYTYDGNDRIKTVTAAGQVTRFDYEPGSDNRTLAANASVESTFSYEMATGRLAQRTDQIDGRTLIGQYGYDANDNLTDITYPSGVKVRYSYDSENHITRVFNPTSGADYANEFLYYPTGMPSRYSAGNGVQTLVGTDERNRIATITAGDLSLSYCYDGVGNVTRIMDGRDHMSHGCDQGALTYDQTFTYDNLDRLQSLTSDYYGSATYAYDAHGNRQDGLTYDPNNRFHLAAIGTVPVTYDANGNMKTGAQSVYSYNADNQMDSATVAGVTTTYAYDPDDWRVKKATDGQSASYYFRGPGGQLLTEWSGTVEAPTTRDYVYAGSRLIAAISATQPGGSAPADGSVTASFTLRSGQTLHADSFLESADGRATLWYQNDGNLVLYHESVPAWASNTPGTSLGRAVMQTDGNFVVYDGAGTPICNSHTDGHIGAFLVLKNNGSVGIYDAEGTPLRSTPGANSICTP